MRKEKSISSGTTHPRQEERRSGYRVASKARSERLDVASKSDSASDPTLHGGSLCLTPISSTWQVCQLETRPERISQRCVHAGLVESDSICLPTVQSTPNRTSQNQKGACNASVSSSNMDSTTLVAPTDRTYCGLPGISGEQSPIAAGCDRARSDTPSVPLVEVSRMENIRRRYETMGISEKAVELLCKNVKSSTTKTYNVSWAQWSRWCSERQSDPVSCSVSDILTFLAEQFSNGKEYRTINVLRFAISSAHCHVDDKPVGQHPLVIRLMKGVSISRPPQPRYQHTWDVSVVTSYFSRLWSNSTVSLKQLSQKLCMLMALACPERSSIMASLDITYMRYYPEGVKFATQFFESDRIAAIWESRCTLRSRTNRYVRFPALQLTWIERKIRDKLTTSHAYLSLSKSRTNPSPHRRFLVGLRKL